MWNYILYSLLDEYLKQDADSRVTIETSKNIRR
ncbi:MAG TPA: hypothetical protein DER13_01380 [Clostridiales bacterium]|nr:hypothetical protein [Clostridiales bacterium]